MIIHDSKDHRTTRHMKSLNSMCHRRIIGIGFGAIRVKQCTTNLLARYASLLKPTQGVF